MSLSLTPLIRCSPYSQPPALAPAAAIMLPVPLPLQLLLLLLWKQRWQSQVQSACWVPSRGGTISLRQP
jgi:hypothetical protein